MAPLRVVGSDTEAKGSSGGIWAERPGGRVFSGPGENLGVGGQREGALELVLSLLVTKESEGASLCPGSQGNRSWCFPQPPSPAGSLLHWAPSQVVLCEARLFTTLLQSRWMTWRPHFSPPAAGK